MACWVVAVSYTHLAPEMQKHVYSKQEKQTLERRFKDPNDPLKAVSYTHLSRFTTIWFNYVKFVVPVIILVIFISNLI